jgi:uncharacterized delta-60 repeat protein
MLIPLGILASGSKPYRLQTLGTGSQDDSNSIAIDSLGNAFVCGRSAISGIFYGFLAKLSPKGEISWQKTLGSASNTRFFGVSVDSSDSVYVAGFNGTDVLIAKYNNSGSIQWQKTLTGASTESAFNIAIDQSDNVYVVGFTDSQGQGNEDQLVVKYNSSGIVQWQRIIGGANSEAAFSCAIDSNGDVYLAGLTEQLGVSLESTIIKYNSSGTLQWQRKLATSALAGLAINSSNDLIACGRTESSSNALLIKYNSAGTLQWQRTLQGAGTESFSAVTLDSAGNAYVIGSSSTGSIGSNDVLIAKYDGSGTLEWQRLLGSTSSDTGQGIQLDNQGNIILIGSTSGAGAGSTDFLIAVLPPTGNLTGTYELDGVSYTYAAGTLTAGTPTFISSTTSFTSAASTLTEADGSLTGANGTAITYRVNL